MIIRRVMSDEFDIVCKHNEVRLPNIVSSLAYYLDYFIQSVGLYNKEIHVLSEMNRTIACSIKAENDLNYSPTIDLYDGTVMSINQLFLSFKHMNALITGGSVGILVVY